VDVSTGEYLGNQFVASMARVASVLSNGIEIDSGSGGGGLSTAAIIAISVVCVLVVGALVAVGMVVWHKRKKDSGWKKYQDAVREIQKI